MLSDHLWPTATEGPRADKRTFASQQKVLSASAGIANIYAFFQTESACLQQKYFRDPFDHSEPYKQLEKEASEEEKGKEKGNENEIWVLGFLLHSLPLSDKALVF